jgi:phosphoribosyl 1,2-cyclic phosphodiesterase
MFIKCWGARGSICVSGSDFIKFGGDTTCIEIRTQADDIIIIDAGTGIRRLGNHLLKEKRKRYHFLLTHVHWDHLMGLPFFHPLYREDTELLIHKCPFPDHYVEEMISKVMAPPNFPLRYAEATAQISYLDACPTDFKIGSVVVTPVPLSHPDGGNGYKLTEKGRSFVFLTDNELGYRHAGGLDLAGYVSVCQDVDLLVHDAEYTPEEYPAKIEWGHSSYADVLQLGCQANVKQLGLFHHNQERTDHQVDHIVSQCQEELRRMHCCIRCFAVEADMTFDL